MNKTVSIKIIRPTLDRNIKYVLFEMLSCDAK